MENYIGCDRKGWAFLANKAIWHNKSKQKPYGDLFRTGANIATHILIRVHIRMPIHILIEIHIYIYIYIYMLTHTLIYILAQVMLSV